MVQLSRKLSLEPIELVLATAPALIQGLRQVTSQTSSLGNISLYGTFMEEAPDPERPLLRLELDRAT